MESRSVLYPAPLRLDIFDISGASATKSIRALEAGQIDCPPRRQGARHSREFAPVMVEERKG